MFNPRDKVVRLSDYYRDWAELVSVSCSVNSCTFNSARFDIVRMFWQCSSQGYCHLLWILCLWSFWSPSVFWLIFWFFVDSFWWTVGSVLASFIGNVLNPGDKRYRPVKRPGKTRSVTFLVSLRLKTGFQLWDTIVQWTSYSGPKLVFRLLIVPFLSSFLLI